MKPTKRSLKVAVAGLLTAAIAGGGLLAIASTAFAATTAPPWEPDTNAAAPYGNLTFYNSNGVQVTSGTNLSSPFAYVVASTAPDSGANKAIVNFYLPVHGVLPAGWTGTAESGTTTFNPASSLPTGTPADIVADAASYPVAATSAANITSFISVNPSDTTTGYVNTIQVRLTDSGAGGAGNSTGTYWESDIGYNTTSSAITLDGTTVPADGWAVLYPFVSATTTSLTASAAHVVTPNSVTLTATVSSSAAGTVQFYNGTTFLADVTPSAGVATYTYAPTAGSYSYTATFVPAPGDETASTTTVLGSGNASFVGGSSSSSVPVSVTPPQVATSTALSTNTASAAYGAPVDLTATVTESDSVSTGLAGNVEFLNGTTAIAGCTAQVTTVSTTSPYSGTATCDTSSLPQGGNSITAVFSPTSNSYASSTSSAVSVTVAAPAVCPPANAGSVCSDTQNLQVTINPGTITISTPYTSTNPFVLPAMTLSSDGTYFQSSAQFPKAGDQDITVTSTLAPAYAWTLSVSATALTSGANSIPASGLGLTGGEYNSTGTSAYAGDVAFNNIVAKNPSPVDGPGTGPGLGSTAQTWAVSSASDGTALMYGTLTLYAATSTPAGTYSGTITFSVS
ncbi:MAG: Ig-like domain repeat protein [Acidimicrobiales bacterium]